jgi:hypothetical protein
MSGVGGRIGIHTTIKRRTNERSFIASTSRGALFNGLQERGTCGRLRRLTRSDDSIEEQT